MVSIMKQSTKDFIYVLLGTLAYIILVGIAEHNVPTV